MKKFVMMVATIVLINVFFLFLCVQDAAGDAEEAPVADQVSTETVEETAKSECASTQLKSTGIEHIAGIDTEAVLTLEEPRWTDEEALMLVTLAMAEAEGEDIEGKALVILVVLNRVGSDSFPDSIEGVIFQKNQFSPVKPGHRYYKVTPNADCWAALALVESGWDESQGALYFERNTERSTWHSRNLVELFDHGMHTFYTEEDISK